LRTTCLQFQLHKPASATIRVAAPLQIRGCSILMDLWVAMEPSHIRNPSESVGNTANYRKSIDTRKLSDNAFDAAKIGERSRSSFDTMELNERNDEVLTAE
jgi:hypothetical protein